MEPVGAWHVNCVVTVAVTVAVTAALVERSAWLDRDKIEVFTW